jgi:hypothetical protein
MAESKLHENLRYLGYTIVAIGGMILVGLIYLFLEPIIDFLWSIIYLLIFLGFIAGLILAAIYLLLFRNRE